MNLGRFELCLKVKDFGASVDFYKRLGFSETVDWKESGYSSLTNGNLTISLYKDDIGCNIMNFRGEDVARIAQELGIPWETEHDGSIGAWTKDPDGNIIYFNTAPGEKL
jgi:catechol 2,3-dioxygenase-like lactoylglutathione lyase family enzyme